MNEQEWEEREREHEQEFDSLRRIYENGIHEWKLRVEELEYQIRRLEEDLSSSRREFRESQDRTRWAGYGSKYHE